MTTLDDESQSDASKELNGLMRRYRRDSVNSDASTARIIQIIQEHPQLCFEQTSKGDLLLHKAVECHSPLAVLEAIVETNPDAVDEPGARDGQTPLHRACLYATSLEPDAFKLLASKTAASTKCSLGYLPIHFYCDSQGKYEVDLRRLKVLVNAYPESIQQVDREGRPPLFLACRGASLQNLPAIQYLMQQSPQAIEQTRDWFGFNILHLACTGSCIHSLQVIQFLVEQHPKSARESSYYGSSPLHLLLYEASHDVSEIARFLIDLHPECVTLLDSDDCTPLHMFLHVGSNRGTKDLETLRLLVDAYPDALAMVNSMGRTPLHLLCHVENDHVSVDILRHFVKFKYCRQILESDSGDMPILHMICSRNNYKSENLRELVKALAISKNSVQVRNVFGETALHLLCRQGALPDTCQVLLEKCPELVSMQDNNGFTPLHVAIKSSCSLTSWRYDQTIQCLLESCPSAVQVKDGNGVTPLMVACEEYAPLGIIYQLVRIDPVGLLESRNNVKQQGEKRARVQSKLLQHEMRQYERAEFESQRNGCMCCAWLIMT